MINSPADTQRIPLPPPPPITHVQKPTIKLDMTVEEQKEHIEKELKNNDNFPSELPIKENIGKSDLMFPRTYSQFHEATPMLYDYAKNGCPVDCGEDWNTDKIMKLLKRGPHRSSM